MRERHRRIDLAFRVNSVAMTITSSTPPWDRIFATEVTGRTVSVNDGLSFGGW